MRFSVSPLLLLAATLAACAAPAPPTAPSPVVSRVAATPTPRPEQPIALELLAVDESPIPPADATPTGLGAARPTATPAATAEAGFKYVTFTFAVVNHADGARLVGIGGPDPRHTNLADAVLQAQDGTRFKAYRSYSSFGLRTATARSLASYPVLLRLPPGLHALGESFGSASTNFAQANSVTFRVPVSIADYASLTVPPLAIATKSPDDEVAKRERALVGALEPLDLTGVHGGYAAPLAALSSVGSSSPGRVSIAGADLSDPADFQARNRGWKQLTVALRFHNDDPSAAHTFAVSAWVFGNDGIVYTGDVPALGDFGRAASVPEPAVIAAWDGRPAGPDGVSPGQEQLSRRGVFQVPATLRGGVLVLAGETEAILPLTLN